MIRPVCDVLEEMRVCIKTSNYNHFFSLVDEAKEMTLIMAEAAIKDDEDD